MSLDVDGILDVFNKSAARYVLIGGINFSLRHVNIVTFDVDFWVEDTDENLKRVNEALIALGAEWGPTEREWKAVPQDSSWLKRQSCFCLTTPAGAVDVFRAVRGLENKFEECYSRAVKSKTPHGTAFVALSDEDMLRCQEALDEQERKLDRMRILREALGRGS